MSASKTLSPEPVPPRRPRAASAAGPGHRADYFLHLRRPRKLWGALFWGAHLSPRLWDRSQAS